MFCSFVGFTTWAFLLTPSEWQVRFHFRHTEEEQAVFQLLRRRCLSAFLLLFTVLQRGNCDPQRKLDNWPVCQHVDWTWRQHGSRVLLCLSLRLYNGCLDFKALLWLHLFVFTSHVKILLIEYHRNPRWQFRGTWFERESGGEWPRHPFSMRVLFILVGGGVIWLY